MTQNNPEDPLWGYLTGDHFVSTDLVKLGIAPSPPPHQPFEINGCWFASVTFLPESEPVILYTDIDDKQMNVRNSLARYC
ncbi:beta-fructofuranosidase, insoluble isoenzyme [Carex littledalei]|uniref:Beta-fructofuranosidase, insoluble isoenzyme n=1 Tax=Carex littledalei TaxID=544730 RepID=A0A833QKT8_9POAL|nr:beta-fructofuranosidase, insoluble isoenzyme [Carex littledalei]